MVQKHCLEAELLQYLPPSVSRAMQKLSLRFDVDLKAVRRYLVSPYLSIISSMLIMTQTEAGDAENLNMLENNFLWGWLNGKDLMDCPTHSTLNSFSSTPAAFICASNPNSQILTI